jgi:aryl-alcohol dehydrogenase-like predicted oxidoreductase
MVRRRLGDLEVGCIGLGAMHLNSEEQAKEVIHAALKQGVEFIDTSPAYGDFPGQNEKLVALAVSSFPDEQVRKRVVIASKAGLILNHETKEREPISDPQQLITSVEGTLKSLDTDSLELLQLQMKDARVPLEESLEVLAKLKEQGMVKRIGLSNVTQEQLKAASKITAITSIQNLLNIVEREDLDNGLLSWCQNHNVAYIPHTVLGGAEKKEIISTAFPLQQLATKHRCSVQQICLAWLLLSSNTIPIPGASNPDAVLDNVHSTEISLDLNDLAALADFYDDL